MHPYGVPLLGVFYTGVDVMLRITLTPAYYKDSHPNGRDLTTNFLSLSTLAAHDFLACMLGNDRSHHLERRCSK